MNNLASYIAAFVFVSVHLGNLAHFPSLREVGLMEEDTPKYCNILSDLLSDHSQKIFVETKQNLSCLPNPLL